LKIANILKDSNYKLSQFTKEDIYELEGEITTKTTAKGSIPYVFCRIRGKQVRLTAEEIVRQLYIRILMDRYQYPAERMQVEYPVHFGHEIKRADIVVFDKDKLTDVLIIVELKSPKWNSGKEQLKSYCHATGAPIAVWTNGDTISYWNRRDPNHFFDLSHIPMENETLEDVLQERFTIDDLVAKDKLINERKSLKDLIQDMEDEVLAHAGVDVFEEVFKLIFAKLYDEWLSGRDRKRFLEFRNTGQTETALNTKIQKLFTQAKDEWQGVFEESSRIQLSPSHLGICVSSLQDVKLFNSNLEVVDEAFEYLMSKSSKGEKGQYFTPRYVIDMCVKMLNPQAHETLIDTAAGSSGFTVHGIFHVWKQIMEEKGLHASHLFTVEQKPHECDKYVQDKVFAIDFDEKAVRVARTLNLIAGDGQTNVLHLNTLDYQRWDEITNQEEWNDTFNEGFKKLKKLRQKKDSNKEFKFDLLMANPPFAGDIKDGQIITRYELGKNAAGKWRSKVGRDILFIERNLDFLRPGGRMAIVLPQGRFNNASDKMIRDFIAERCRILAVVGLHQNTFKPHTGTKTSVLFVQKWNDNPKSGPLCPKVDDYNIFFATMQKPGKDNSGEKIYVRQRNPEFQPIETKTGPIATDAAKEVPNKYDSAPEFLDKYALDSHGHLFVDHDLFNHDGKTSDGIAEAFLEFGKKENLSFF